MSRRSAALKLVFCMLLGPSVAAVAAPSVQAQGGTGWQAPNEAGAAARYGAGNAAPTASNNATGGAAAQPPSGAAPKGAQPRAVRAQVSKGSGALPNDHGQVWREYDITPYTMRTESSQHPEQAIVDWILRETGYETWHSTPVGLLSADRRVLRVYHTPQMQAIVADIVDRFVNTEAQNHGFGLRIITLKNPNWRTRALPLMAPIPVESPGVQGWIMAREDAAVLLAELGRRTDYRDHNPPHQMALNGQTIVVSSMKPRQYVKGIIQNQQVWPGYQPEVGKLEEGFTLEFAPLLSLDTHVTDAVVKLRLTQVEKMLPVQLDVPSPVAPNQRTQIEVPQMTMVQIHERFRWPTDHVLLLSMGVVASPAPEQPNPLTSMLPLPKSAPRSDAVLMIESRGPSAPNQTGGAGAPRTAVRPGQTTFHGRY